VKTDVQSLGESSIVLYHARQQAKSCYPVPASARERAWGGVRHLVNQKAFGFGRRLGACARGVRGAGGFCEKGAWRHASWRERFQTSY
jgi:hypothetical protein